MQRLFFTLCILLQSMLIAQAQTEENANRRLIAEGRPFFVPHWSVKAQGGVAYDIGEAPFDQLLSPAIQLSTTYRFTELIGVRGSLSGFWARNQYAYPHERYQWNFLQPMVEAELNLTSLILGKTPERRTRVYLFGGAGVAFTFNNNDAVDANQRYGVDFQKLWNNSRWHMVTRAGLGVDYQINDDIALNVEANANILPDHFNSKRGKHDNKDWHFNFMVGVAFNLGKTHGRTEDLYERIVIPEPVKEPVEEKIEFTVNIQFIINQSIIRSNQMNKLYRLVNYLNEHPNAYVRLSGYADRETGNSEINQRLSRERSVAVSQWLQSEGIDESRIRRFAHGDRIQPFDLPEDNRVTICFVYNPNE